MSDLSDEPGRSDLSDGPGRSDLGDGPGHADLGDAIGRAVLADAGLDPAAGPDRDGHLRLIAAAARGETQARLILGQAVSSARGSGASWGAIGAQLGMSRQAAQQRFGATAGELGPDERWLGPVTAFDELAELELAGRAGWRTVEVGMLAHRMQRTDTQWEHRRILWRPSLAREFADGWVIGARAFPWVYLVRDLQTPPVGSIV